MATKKVKKYKNPAPKAKKASNPAPVVEPEPEVPSVLCVPLDMPIPPRKVMNRKCKYPFAAMKVGDGLHIPVKKFRTVYSAASNFAKKQDPPWKFVCRGNIINPETGKGGIGVWRTE